MRMRLDAIYICGNFGEIGFIGCAVSANFAPSSIYDRRTIRKVLNFLFCFINEKERRFVRSGALGMDGSVLWRNVSVFRFGMVVQDGQQATAVVDRDAVRIVFNQPFFF